MSVHHRRDNVEYIAEFDVYLDGGRGDIGGGQRSQHAHYEVCHCYTLSD